MKKILSGLVIVVLAVVVAGCELDNDKGRDLRFDNVSRFKVTVIPLTTEWKRFDLGPGQQLKLTDIENPDFTWKPLDLVELGSSSSERNVIFVNRAPVYTPPIIIVTNK